MYFHIYMKSYDIYIYLIILIKIGFVLMAISHIYLVFKGEKLSDLDKKILFWKERFEFIFVATMAILLIYIFNPRTNRINFIDRETKLLFYLFGFILIITANWNIFIKETPWFKLLQESVGHST